MSNPIPWAAWVLGVACRWSPKVVVIALNDKGPHGPRALMASGLSCECVERRNKSERGWGERLGGDGTGREKEQQAHLVS